MNTPYLGLIIYLFLILIVGFLTWRMNKTKEDFILGGRRLGAFVIAFSERTAAESAWLVLGLSGALYSVGLVEIWTIIGCISGIIFYWYVIAKKLRVISEQYGAITLPEYLFRFCGSYGNLVRGISMFIIVFFFSFYISAQFIGGGKVLDVTFGIPQTWGIVIASLVVALYTMMGGFTAVCYTDVIQGILMIITLVFMPIVGLIVVSHHNIDLWETLKITGQTASLTGGKVGWPAIATIIGGLSWGLGYMGQPHLITKFMAINNPDAIKRSRTIAIIWTILAYIGAGFIGIIGIGLVQKGLISGSGLTGEGADPERILPVLASFLFPLWFSGILIAGAAAAMMSTADSQLLITTSTVVEDFYCKALKKEVSQKKLVFLSRLFTVIIALIGFILAFTSKNLIYNVVSMAWSGLGSSFGPAILLSLHWKRMNVAGVLASMIVGTFSTILWLYIPGLNNFISVRFSSFLLATAAAIIASYLYHPIKKDN